MTKYADVGSYYVHRWGQPNREAEFTKDSVTIGVLKWEASASTEGVTLYTTVGTSDYPLNGVGPLHRQEFFVGFSPELDEIASSLARLSLHTLASIPCIAAGHTYRFTHEKIDGTDFQGFIFLAPPDDGILTSIQLVDGRHIEFVMVIPVFSAELARAATEGVDNLLSAMEENLVQFWNPHRNALQVT